MNDPLDAKTTAVLAATHLRLAADHVEKAISTLPKYAHGELPKILAMLRPIDGAAVMQKLRGAPAHRSKAIRNLLAKDSNG